MWKTVKRLLQKGGGKCIIVEDGKPTYVVMGIEEYERMLEGGSPIVRETEEANKNIDQWRQEEQKEIQAPEENQSGQKNSEVKVEDIPF